jgi:predicted phage tail protein
MKLFGLLLIVVGWLIPVLSLGIAHSTAGRFILVILGIGIILYGILGVLSKAHNSKAVWKS